MSVMADSVVNENYSPDDMEEKMLRVLTDERFEDNPWGYTTPSVAAEIVGTRRQYTSRALQNLVKAGWVEQVGRGVYRFVEDPRER